MLLFPNAKLNLGLNILKKRSDGFHAIETLFYPLTLSDVLELVPSDTFSFQQTGITIDGDDENNLCVKAFRLMQERFGIQSVQMHLHKVVPMGAGLGGGSSDAAFVLKGLNELFGLQLDETQLISLAAELGSDCPFFILNRPVFAEGRGEVFTASDLSLKGYTLVLVKPDVHVPTSNAYANVRPAVPNEKLNIRLAKPIKNWKSDVLNDFEPSIFSFHPEIAQLKEKLYEMGAIYASMSGSGSSVFGIFENLPDSVNSIFPDEFVWTEQLN